MKTRIAINLLFLLPIIFWTANLHADWKSDWEQTVAAAKKEGQPLSTGGGSISLIKGAPHPNAACVFINWFLSRKGQTAMQKSNDLYGELPPNSRRVDIPKNMLPAENRLVEGRKYLDVARHEFTDMAPVLRLAKEIVKAQEQR